jgi:hypothetical protein
MARFTEVKYMYSVVRDHGVEPDGGFTGRDEKNGGFPFSANFPLFLIQEAWNRGMDVEDLADGFGEGNGTHGDWSAIRDSTTHATTKMFERALNYLFGDEDTSPAASPLLTHRHQGRVHTHRGLAGGDTAPLGHTHPRSIDPHQHYPATEEPSGDHTNGGLFPPVRRGSYADHAAEFPEHGCDMPDHVHDGPLSPWQALQALVAAHDQEPSMLTEREWDAARRALGPNDVVSFEHHAGD